MNGIEFLPHSLARAPLHVSDIIPSQFPYVVAILHQVRVGPRVATWAQVADLLAESLEPIHDVWKRLSDRGVLGLDIGAPRDGTLTAREWTQLLRHLSGGEATSTPVHLLLWDAYGISTQADTTASWYGDTYYHLRTELSEVRKFYETPLAQGPNVIAPDNAEFLAVSDRRCLATYVAGDKTLARDLRACRTLDTIAVKVTDRLITEAGLYTP